MSEVTEIFQKIESGDETAASRLLPVVYDELKKLAASQMARESPAHTLQTTALVHEAWMRMNPDGEQATGSELNENKFRSRGHFFCAAAESMRRILIESARKRKRLKRGGDRKRCDLDPLELSQPETSVDLVELDEVLGRLEAEDANKASVVKLRYFVGLTVEETASVLGVTDRTVRRHWDFARAWLLRELSDAPPSCSNESACEEEGNQDSEQATN